ncbi:MAG: branched-chain amino acid ABC transporter permease [Leptolyngbyaceae cyanobacterium RU_5_1]|nr:branched-chain amino acid ABC transporter permease [Leptolyngbyaceae cyanobacterium RU_5_1]
MDPQLAQLFLNGVAVGSIIALASVGLTLTYGILRLSNFAHGDLMTLGAYLTLSADTLFTRTLGQNTWNVWLAMVLGALGTIAAVLLSETVIWSPMRSRRATSTTLIIISIGLALFIRNGIILIWGGSNQNYNLPVAEALELGPLRIPFYDVVVLVLAIVAITAIHFLLQNTKIGKAMRAVADDLDLARVTGIKVDQVILWTWIIAAGLTALGGSMLGLIEAVRPNMGWFLIINLFSAVILGGIGNPYGAIAGAFTIGIAQEMSTYVLPNEYKGAIALVIMILVLLFRPQGLFRGTV